MRAKEQEENIQKIFGSVEFIEAEGISGETGFLTEVMTEEAFEQKVSGWKNILQRIRVV